MRFGSGWLFLLLAACGASGTYQSGVYRDAETSYAVASPGDGWDAIEVRDRNDLAWRNPRVGAIVQVNSTCSAEYDVPLTALTNHLLVGFTERDLQSQELEAMDGREALRTHVLAKLDGVPRELMLVVLKKNDCTYDFALVAPPGEPFAAGRVSFDAMLRSFATRE